MIEEIKDKTWYRDNNNGKFYNCCKVGDDRTPIIKIDDLFEILNNQPDYKSAWNELKESQSTNCAYVNLGEELEVRFEELEQKYKLGGE